MVFSTLTQRDKDAFFALLDEYFDSRPGLLNASINGISPPVSASHTGNASLKAATNTPPRPPARALSNATSNSNIGAASFKARATPPAPAVPSRTRTPQIVEPARAAVDRDDDDDVDEAPVSVSSRIAAAQASIGSGYATGGKPPVPAPRRVSTQSVSSQGSSVPSSRPSAPPTRTVVSPPAPSSGNGAPNGLVSSRGIGSIDTSSGGAAVGSVFKYKGIGKNGDKGGPKIPAIPAFEKPRTKDAFAPPPRRGDSAGTSPTPVTQDALPAEEEEDTAQGEWVQALYDHDAAEATDLSFKSGDQIWVTERTSKDWWMADIDGKQGLVPATYVKPL